MYAFGIHSGSPPNFGFLGPCLLRMGCGRLVKPKKPLLLRMYYYIRFCHSSSNDKSICNNSPNFWIPKGKT